MLEGISTSQRIEFVSSHDKTEPKTIFVFRPLSGIEMMSYQNLNETEILLKFLNATIFEIKNCSIEKSEFISSLNSQVLSEIIIKAVEINRLTDTDKKKS